MSYQILVLAAGKGTRFRSDTPKVLHRVCGLTLLSRVIRAGMGASPTQILVVKGVGAAEVEHELDTVRMAFPQTKITSVLQQQQLGTGDAVRAGIPALGKERVLILPGDSPLLTSESVKKICDEDDGADLRIISYQSEAPTGYGRIVRDKNKSPLKVVEEKDCDPELRKISEVNSSLYLCSPEFIEKAVASLDSHNAQGELYLTDCVEYAVKNKRSISAYIYPNPIDLAGANTRAELAELEKEARRRINLRVMESGVTLENASDTFIDEDVKLGRDIFLGSGTRLYGKTEISDRCVVDGATLIVNSKIGESSHVKFGSMIEESIVGRDAKIGPFAHLRPNTQLAASVHIGNFVETKAAKFGDFSKANHLSYIGDAVIGSSVNIGAGTITCNYDGFHKHQTVVKDKAFVGSNTSLVAPIEVGEGAYIGSGSVITKDVPADALSLERSEQKIIPDWAKKKRAKIKG